jgi:DamX protein
MSAAAKISSAKIETGSVAAISTNARIDYILRFSKQAVLVVDELGSASSHIGSLFLDGLSDDHNAAYVGVSAKLNNIQIRCRIIEQLFSEVLFDPEQSLAVSILRLTKEHKQAISIVIDQAQLLSFKLIHELCYLAEVAKKNKQVINVVMLASYQAGTIIAKEKSLFKQKISIVAAESGQLLKLDDKVFKPNKQSGWFKSAQNIMLLTAILVALLVAAFTMLQQRDLFSFSALPTKIKTPISDFTTESTKHQLNPTTVPHTSKAQQSVNDETATMADIYKALTSKPHAVLPVASPSDILTAIESTKISRNEVVALQKTIADKVSLNNVNTTNTVVEKIKILKSEALKNNALKSNVTQLFAHAAEKSPQFKFIFNEAYYLQAKQGYIIQLAGFSDETFFEDEKSNFKDIDYGVYRRLLNGSRYIVVTSQLYASKAQALKAITLLPQALQREEPWVKAVTEIQKEISAYQKSLN